MALKEFGVQVDVKFLNDVLVNGKKVSGSMARLETHGDNIKLSIGIGVNLNCTLESL